MSKYKLLALDMDGTTYHRLGDVVMENVEAINKCLKTEAKVVFVTGRPVLTPLNRLELYEYDHEEVLFAAFNGALIYDIKNHKVIHQELIDKKTVREVFQLADLEEFNQIELWAYTSNDTIAYINAEIETSYGIKHETKFFEHSPIHFTGQEEQLDCYKFLGFNLTQEFVDKLKEMGLEVAWSPGAIAAEITKKGINKKFAVEYLMNYYGFKQEEILAMGDGENDIPMLEFAGHSIAPSNANDLVKSHAKEVSQYSNLEGVVAKAIYKYVLGE